MTERYALHDHDTFGRRVSRFSPKRLLWLSLGLLCLTLGTIGLFLPLMPTTSFMLVAAFAFARSSPRLHRWLLAHRVFGPLIVNWQAYGAITLKAKIFSLISMALILIISAALGVPLWVIGVQFCVLVLVSLFLWTRPTPPKTNRPR